MVRENVDRSFETVLTGQTAPLADLEEREEYIDYLNKELASYISRAIAFESNQQDSAEISACFKIASDL